MPFTHKLSKRLAVIRQPAVLGMFFLGGCERVTTDPPIAPPSVPPPPPPQPPPPPSAQHAGWHVGPNGSSSNVGTASQPWSLTYALSGASGKIQPGDTVWLHGGTYRGQFRATVAGSAGNPV